MLLHKWEKGQLQIPLNPPIPTLSYHGRYSTSSLTSSSGIPRINIDGVGSSSGSMGIVPWQTFNGKSLAPPTKSGTGDSTMDANLQRYLNQGRRHTLGTAHNMLIIPQEDMNRLRKINESSSSQASSGFGSSSTNVPPIHPETQQPLMIPALSTGIEEPKTSIGSLASSSRQFLHLPKFTSSRRRASDGGHYLEAYRQFLQKRTSPIYSHQTSVEGGGVNGTQPTTAKQLLQEKIESDRIYGRLPQRHKLPYNPHLLSSSGLEGANIIAQMVQPLTSSTLPLPVPTANLREQCQPFHDITQQQIREQLEQLHMSNSSPEQGSLPQSSGVASGGSSTSSISSRKNSTGIIAQLLAATPPTTSLTFPTQTIAASLPSDYNSLPTSGENMRRYSVQPPQSSLYPPTSNRHHRKTLPELHPQLIIVEPPNNLHPQASTSSGLGESSPESSLGVTGGGGVAFGRLSPPYLPVGSPGGGGGGGGGRGSPLQWQERQRRTGVTLTSIQHAQVAANMEEEVCNDGNRTGLQDITQQQQPFLPQPEVLQHSIQQIPIFFNQHISLLNPNVANQIAQQQMSSLVHHISNVLSTFKIIYQCNGNVFTISHRGVDFQIHVQVSPHYAIQNALQLNLQYMHIGGDSQLYQSLCTELAPHFVPSVQ